MPRVLSNTGVFFGLWKGYVNINILLCPLLAAKGGWLSTAAMLFVTIFVNTIAALRLVNIGNTLNLYSYPSIAEAALGVLGMHLN